jgi:hypothetical protein
MTEADTTLISRKRNMGNVSSHEVDGRPFASSSNSTKSRAKSLLLPYYRAMIMVVLVILLSIVSMPGETAMQMHTASTGVVSISSNQTLSVQQPQTPKPSTQTTTVPQQPREFEQQAAGLATTKVSCQDLIADYQQALANRTNGASVMVKRLQVLGHGCGSHLGDYFWNFPPNNFSASSLGEAPSLPTQQLVHMYYDTLTPDISFVVASALAAKNDWRNLQILVWLPPPIYKQFTQVSPPDHWIDCPNHVTVLEYNMTVQASDTVLKDRVAGGLPRELAYDPAYTTDAVRLILLYKYGGLWVDVDSMFVLDFNDLFDIEFAGYTYVNVLWMNGAMM